MTVFLSCLNFFGDHNGNKFYNFLCYPRLFRQYVHVIFIIIIYIYICMFLLCSSVICTHWLRWILSVSFVPGCGLTPSEYGRYAGGCGRAT